MSPLNPLFKDRLKAVDSHLCQALRALFDERIELERPRVSEETNELLGEKYRAYERARELVAESFNDLRAYMVTEEKKTTFNKEK